MIERKPLDPHVMQWLSRTIAIVIVMVAPGLLGGYLDGQWNTHFLKPLGFAMGTLVAFLVMAPSMIPRAAGRPIVEDESSEKVDDDHVK